MAYLAASTVLTRLTATIEVGNLTLDISGHQFSSEWDADTHPALVTVNELLVSRLTLIPHTMAVIKAVGYRCIEVFLIHQQMVVGGFQVVLDKVTIDGPLAYVNKAVAC